MEKIELTEVDYDSAERHAESVIVKSNRAHRPFTIGTVAEDSYLAGLAQGRKESLETISRLRTLGTMAQNRYLELKKLARKHGLLGNE